MFSLNTVLARLPQPGDREERRWGNDGYGNVTEEANIEAKMSESAVIRDLMTNLQIKNISQTKHERLPKMEKDGKCAI